MVQILHRSLMLMCLCHENSQFMAEALDTHGSFKVIEEVISQLGNLSGVPEDS